MPKSHGRKQYRSSRPRGRSGDPRKQPAAHLTARCERIFARISGIAGPGTAAEEQSVPRLLPSVLELTAAQRGEPFDDCLAACETLRHAYTLVGIAAETRAVDLYVRDRTTGSGVLHGTPDPSWTGPRHDGHCAVWLPGARMFVDPTVERFPEVARLGVGPVFGRSLAVLGEPAALARAEEGALPAGAELNMDREHLLLMYNVADERATRVLLGHPRVASRADDLRRAGANLAGLSLEALRVLGSWDEARTGTPYPKVRAYLEALDGSPCLTGDPDVRFLVRGLGGIERRLRLDEVPL
ncbi:MULTISPECIES: hypothetical protein [Thermomonosporaceae]|uniref:hypothetical protein n=1 Tax=Thermomonosporaceae TaxID=2012 RepID=UPI00255B2602|nr:MULTISPECIES: hypothetical protein [Thermomonosporaceae]MDL4770945.1 hypothetical protein [Actinomadura xylanilytica]